MLNLKDKDICLLSDLMEEAESSWQSILKRQTIATLTNEIHKKCPKENLDMLKATVEEKMVL
ncbi:transcriptional regulator, partial [Priestia megaterium]